MARGVAKKVEVPNPPKRALTSYMIYYRENYESLRKPGRSTIQVAKAAGKAWRGLADKSKWVKKAEEDKKRYDREMAAYKSS